MQESWGDETTDRERHEIGATDFFPLGYEGGSACSGRVERLVVFFFLGDGGM